VIKFALTPSQFSWLYNPILSVRAVQENLAGRTMSHYSIKQMSKFKKYAVALILKPVETCSSSVCFCLKEMWLQRTLITPVYAMGASGTTRAAFRSCQKTFGFLKEKWKRIRELQKQYIMVVCLLCQAFHPLHC